MSDGWVSDDLSDLSESDEDEVREPGSHRRLVSRPSISEVTAILQNLELRFDGDDAKASYSSLSEVSNDGFVRETNKEIRNKQNKNKYINQYLLLENLGKGAFGIVQVVKSMITNEKYALKTFNKAQLRRPIFHQGKKPTSMLDNVFREIEIMKKLHHPNIVQLYEVIDDPTCDRMHLVLEYAHNGAIFEGAAMVDPIEDMDLIWRYFRDMILGFDYLHKNGIVHADIKPENLLVDEHGNVKIGDFGVSIMLAPDANDSFIAAGKGTPAFTAPEVSRGGRFDGFLVDIWAMGVSLYMFITGVCPFAAESILDTYDKVENYDPPMPENAGEDLLDILHRILDKNPVTRITMEELFVHPWVTKRGTEPLIQNEIVDDGRLRSEVIDEAKKGELAGQEMNEFPSKSRPEEAV